MSRDALGAAAVHATRKALGIHVPDPNESPLEQAVRALTAAGHALRSYQYGNSAPDLADAVAADCDAALKRLAETIGDPRRRKP